MVATHCQPIAIGTGECTVPAVPGDAWIGVPGGTKRAVIFIMHGFNGYGTDPPVLAPVDNTYAMFAYYIATLANSLVSAGFVVVMPREVGDFKTSQAQYEAVRSDLTNDPAGLKGTRHAVTIGNYASHLRAWAKRAYPGLPLVVGGMSWGGMTTLRMVKLFPSYWAGYYAHHPAIVISKINPVLVDYSAFSPSGLDIAATDFNAINIPGWFGWGTADSFIDYPNSGDTLTPAIYNAAHTAGMPVTSSARATGHVLDATDAANILSWAGATPNSGQLPF